MKYILVLMSLLCSSILPEERYFKCTRHCTAMETLEIRPGGGLWGNVFSDGYQSVPDSVGFWSLSADTVLITISKKKMRIEGKYLREQHDSLHFLVSASAMSQWRGLILAYDKERHSSDKAELISFMHNSPEKRKALRELKLSIAKDIFYSREQPIDVYIREDE
jgi:hypothetical protein